MELETPEDETIFYKELDRLLLELVEDKSKKNEYIYDEKGQCTYRIDISAKAYHPEQPVQEEPARTLNVPVSVLKSPDATAYKFPYEDSSYAIALIRYQGMPLETLKAELDILTYKNGKPQDANHYIKNRVEVCAISIVLNTHKRYPPSLRRFWTVGSKPNKTLWSSDDIILLNDLRVLDLHWLYCNQTFNPIAQYNEIFRETFNFDAASTFAADNKKANTKAMELGLHYSNMLSLMVLKSKQISDRQRTIREKLKQAPSLIREEKLKPSCRLKASEQDLIDIAAATLLADGNLFITAEIYTQITGESIEPGVLRKRVKWLLGKKIINTSKNRKA